MAWKNFSTWQGRLPHWRADDVTYFVTFRHRRNLEEGERHLLYRNLLRLDGRKWRILAMTILPDRTELLCEVEPDKSGTRAELSDLVEKGKTQAGKAILKLTEERWPPFYGESYDHIVRDESERETFYDGIVDGAMATELVETPEDWPTLYVRDAG